MKRTALALILLGTVACIGTLLTAALAVASTGAVAPAQAAQEFKLGFKTLAELIPDVVGEPLENEQPGSDGFTLQRTTRGLMVWRSTDNWTGFTDGSRTWIEGPFGLAVRDNADRFPWEASPPRTFGDPFAYCSVAGTVDRPDARYAGPPVIATLREQVAAALGGTPSGFNDRSTFWRCMDSRLLVCTVGANLNCGQADTRSEPTPAMAQFCQERPDSDFIPLAVVGHSGIYAWRCQNTTPVIERQVFHVDARGFVSELWHQILPAGKE